MTKNQQPNEGLHNHEEDAADAPAEDSSGARRTGITYYMLIGLLLVLIVLIGFQVVRTGLMARLEQHESNSTPEANGSGQIDVDPSIVEETRRKAEERRFQSLLENIDFDLTSASIPAREIFSGGPPKDGIPSLSNPKTLPADSASYLADSDRVIGVEIEGSSMAYPIKILNHHEIVNDTLGDLPIAVTFCPLCDSAAVFDRRTEKGEKEFGVSGLLYNSNVLLFDRSGSNESLWSQLGAQGVTGPSCNVNLDAVPFQMMTWGEWKRLHPDTRTMSKETGIRRNYDQNPYALYLSNDSLMFPVSETDDRLPSKIRVLGVWSERQAKAYPTIAFDAQRTRIEDSIEGKRVVIEFNPETDSLSVVHADEGLRWMYSFWFSWFAFHPDTDLYE